MKYKLPAIANLVQVIDHRNIIAQIFQLNSIQMKMKAAFLKESASLIILAKDSAINKRFNYNVLMFNRSERTSFMPNHAVFPGGVKEQTDESVLWLKYIKKFGIEDQSLKRLTIVSGPRPGIFRKSGAGCIEKEIALRITAIRETFEEVGVFLCRGKADIGKNNQYGLFRDNFDKKRWQKEVHNDSTKFLHMCEELNVVPDLWSLHEWSTWITPPSFQKRFETIFYLVALNEKPTLIAEETEVSKCLWKNPIEFFEAYRDGEVWLPPPQCYELSRLANLYELEKARQFASERSSLGSTELLPVQHKCNDGIVGILPGDDSYPENPNECTDIIQVDKSVDEFCSTVKKCHRTIYTGSNESWISLNFQPFDGHLSPLDIRKIYSKL